MLARTLLLLPLVATAARAQFTQQGNKLVGANPSGAAYQGLSVAVSADGSTAIVGGPEDGATGTGNTGAVWFYTRSGGAWVQQGPKQTGTNNLNANIGYSVAISADGNTALAGGPLDAISFVNGVGKTPTEQAGAVWVFTRANGVWTEQSKLVVTGTLLAYPGYTVALSADGNTALLGSYSYSPGNTWVFTRANGVWSQGPNLTITADMPLDAPTIVSLSADGNTALIGVPGYNYDESSGDSEGGAWVFTRSNGVWTQQGGELLGTGEVGFPQQGFAVALSSDGNTALLGAPFDSRLPVNCTEFGNSYAAGVPVGAAWVFTRSNGKWTQQGGKLTGTGASGYPGYGNRVALSGDGNLALLGGPNDANTNGACGTTGVGAVWVFARRNGTWTQQGGKLVGSGNQDYANGGSSQGVVALSTDGSTAVIGGYGDNNETGAAWVFTQPVPATQLAVSAPSSATAGTAFQFTVSAPGYSGTVHFTSTDAAAVLPADTAINGSGTFTATLNSARNQTITATDTVTPATTGTSGAITVTRAALTPPSPGSVTSTGSAYTFVFNDAAGYQYLGVVNILVNNFLDGRHACYLAYSVAQNSLILVDDAGDAGGPYAGAANSQCAVTLVSAKGAGNSLTLQLTINFTAAFAGDKIIYMAAGDIALNNSGWQPLGVVRVAGGTPTTTTAVVSASPARGTGLGPTPFTFTWSDTLGFADLGVEDILINSSLDGRHACYIAYSRPLNTLYLEDDNGDALLPGESVAAAGSASNSQCAVSWGVNAVSPGGDNLALTVNIAFTAAFGGNRVVYAAARDLNEANNTGWHAMATWTPQ